MLRAFNKLKNGSDGTSKSKTNIKILKRSDERKARKIMFSRERECTKSLPRMEKSFI